jgi:hypothetical protein
MKKSVQQTIKETTRAISVGFPEEMIRWDLICDGWPVNKADHIILWAKMSILK